MKSQFATSYRGGRRKLPNVFTEHATELGLEVEKVKKKLDKQEKDMEVVFRHLDELLEKKSQLLSVRTLIGLYNILRFPSNFMFKMTSEELSDWKSQNVIFKKERMGLFSLVGENTLHFVGENTRPKAQPMAALYSCGWCCFTTHVFDVCLFISKNLLVLHF